MDRLKQRLILEERISKWQAICYEIIKMRESKRLVRWKYSPKGIRSFKIEILIGENWGN